MHQIRLEYVQPALEFLQLMMKFAFDIRSLAGFIADVSVHVRLGWRRSRTEGPQALIHRRFYTCQ
jgi:hypothetical protein